MQGLRYGLEERKIYGEVFLCFETAKLAPVPSYPSIKLLLGVFIMGETNLPPFGSEFGMSGAVFPYTLPHSFMTCTGAAFEEIGMAYLTFLF
jgi:hypothetical protein